MDLQQYGIIESDIEFIRKKSLAGEWVTILGNIDGTTTELAYTPASGKTFFLYSAKLKLRTSQLPIIGSNSKNMVKADLKIDNVIKDTVQCGWTSGGGTGAVSSAVAGNVGDGVFTCQGLSLVGNGIKKVTINTVEANGDAIAVLSGWIEDT